MNSAAASPRPTADSQVNETMDDLMFYASNLAVSIGEWDLKEIWDTLQRMAPVVGLESFEYPITWPDMEQLRFLFGSLESAMAASDIRRARNDLADMLRAATLA